MPGLISPSGNFQGSGSVVGRLLRRTDGSRASHLHRFCSLFKGFAEVKQFLRNLHIPWFSLFGSLRLRPGILSRDIVCLFGQNNGNIIRIKILCLVFIPVGFQIQGNLFHLIRHLISAGQFRPFPCHGIRRVNPRIFGLPSGHIFQ